MAGLQPSASIIVSDSSTPGLQGAEALTPTLTSSSTNLSLPSGTTARASPLKSPLQGIPEGDEAEEDPPLSPACLNRVLFEQTLTLHVKEHYGTPQAKQKNPVPAIPDLLKQLLEQHTSECMQVIWNPKLLPHLSQREKAVLLAKLLSQCTQFQRRLIPSSTEESLALLKTLSSYAGLIQKELVLSYNLHSICTEILFNLISPPNRRQSLQLNPSPGSSNTSTPLMAALGASFPSSPRTFRTIPTHDDNLFSP